MTEIPVAILEGETAYDRGRVHGEAFADDIRENIDTYLERFEHNGIDETTARESAAQFVPIIENANEAYAEGMRGVADGSDLPLEDVALINVRYEILFTAFSDQTTDDPSDAPEPDPDGCTAFGVQQEATADGHPYIGQNWDWIPQVNTFLMDIRRPDKPNALSLTEAGLVGGKFGMNEHGIGYVVNGLVSPEDGNDPYRTPSHLSHLELLDATRLSEAIGVIIGSDSPCSGNVLLGHPTGEMIDIESTPEDAYYLYPEDGVLTHANHFESESGRGSFEQLAPHSLCRGPRMRRLLTRDAGNITEDSLKTVLRDHFNEPSSICSHIDSELPDHEIGHTNASVIMDLENRRMLLTHGPPCKTDYEEFHIAT
jgi:isopenicillin-N N-acyltransferase-like protein